MSEEQKIEFPQDNDDQSERESQWEDASQQSQDDVLFIAEEELNLVEDEIFGKDDQPRSDNGDEEEKKEDKPKEPDMSTQKFLYHMDSVYTVATSPSNPNMLVSGGGDDIAVIWNILEPANPVTILEGHKDTVDNLCFNFDGKILATGSMDATVTLWEAETGKKKYVLDGPGAEISFVDFHPKGNAIVAGSADSTIWLWNGNNGSFVGALTGHEQGVTCGGFSPDGKAIVSGSADKTLKVWNPKSLECNHTIKGHGFHEESITSIAFHDKNPLVATSSQDKSACISNWNTGKVLGRTEIHEDSVESVIFPKNHDIFATGSLDGKVRVYDLNTFMLKERFNFDSGITKVGFNEERNVLVVSTIGGSLYIFDHRKSEAALRLTGADECINDFTILKDDRIVTAGDDSRVLLFDLRTV